MKIEISDVSFVVFVLMLITGVALVVLSSMEEKTEIGKCYDRYGNQIIGEQCIVKTQVTDNYFNIGILSAYIGIVGIVIQSLSMAFFGSNERYY